MEPMLPPVLIVDDTEDDRTLFLLYARKAGLRNRIHLAASAAEAMTYLEKCSTGADVWPCASFLDIRMPVHSGFDLLSWMIERGYGGKTVIVMHSSTDDPSDITKSFTMGAHAYLRKGNVISDIQKIVATAMTFATSPQNFTEVTKVSLLRQVTSAT